MSFIRKLVPAVALALCASVPGHASMILKLDDTATGGVDVIIIDGQLAGAVSDDGYVSTVADPDGLVNGFISYNGAAGPTFTANVSTGISKPNIGPAQLELNNVSLSSTGGGTLQISVTDTNFLFGANGDPLEIVNELGGVTDGELLYAEGGYGASNLEFSPTNTVLQGPFGPGAFNDTASSATFAGTGGFFSLTEEVAIQHLGAGQVTSFNKTLTLIPEPGTLLLLGSGLAGLVVHGRKPRAR